MSLELAEATAAVLCGLVWILGVDPFRNFKVLKLLVVGWRPSQAGWSHHRILRVLMLVEEHSFVFSWHSVPIQLLEADRHQKHVLQKELEQRVL